MSARRPNQRVGRFDEMPADEAKALMEAMDSMDAPRKIWVPVPVTDEGPCYVDKDEAEMQWGCDSTAYHHDDVVRELVEALEECADDLAEWIAISDSLKRAGFNMDDTGQRLDRARAALAKIAQEG